MKDLFIYHPGTGTVIALSDEVYLCDMADIGFDTFEAMLMGSSVDVSEHKGVRVDNYNMGNLFFEGE